MATSPEPDDSLARLRRADLKTSVFLIALSVAMIWTALGYPLQDSYGGVENSWYVSPSLFPLCIGAALLLLSLVMLGNSIRFAIVHCRWNTYKDSAQFIPAQSALLALMVVIFIGSYTWLLLPATDFVVATCLFLVAFTGVFYATANVRPWSLAFSYLAGSIVLALPGALLPDPLPVPYLTDWLAILFTVILIRALLAQAEHSSRVWLVVLISVLTSVVIAATFRFGLLIPLPHEGLIVEAMHHLRGLLRQ